MGLDLGTNVLFVGVIEGMVYALLAMGLVLIYRATGVIHFGYAQVGAFGALLCGKLVLDEGWPWWAATVVSVGVGSLIGAGWERTVVRRLSNASRLVLLVATIGIGQLMYGAQVALPKIKPGHLYPAAFDLHRQIGSFILRGDHVAVLVGVPLVAGALAWFLNRTLLGLAVKGSAQNRDAAILAGVNVRRLSTLVWGIGGGLATLTVILLFPVRGLSILGDSPVLGPSLLLRALLVALLGRLVSLPLAVVGGVGFGLVESILLANVQPETVELIVFLVLLALLVVRGGASSGSTAQGGASALAGRLSAVPAHLAAHPLVRRVPVAIAVAGTLTAAVLPLLNSDPGTMFTYAKVLLYIMMGLSVVVITGWAGQLSLCQFAFVGVGAFSVAGLTARGLPFLWAAISATIITTLVATAVGLPALRLPGLFLAVATLGFAQVASSWLFIQPLFRTADGQVVVERGSLGPIDLGNQRTYYYLCLVVLIVVTVLLAGLRCSGVGRAIIAVRENELAAAASTLSPTRVKLLAFAVSGAVAGLGGALWGGLFEQLRPDLFGPDKSISLLSSGIIGGVGSLAGAVLGGLYTIGVPNLFGAGVLVVLMVSGVGLMLLLLFLPGGLISLVQRIRDALLVARNPVKVITGQAGGRAFQPPDVAGWLRAGGSPPKRRLAPVSGTGAVITSSLPQQADGSSAPRLSRLALGPRALPAAEGPALVCRGVSVRFGGLIANNEVDLHVDAGELVGLIGTNGAGKSTLMNAIGGYVSTSSGAVEVFGRNVTRSAPQQRARLGVGRVFQDARLFPELTVRECLMVALEARSPSEFLPSLLGLPPQLRLENAKRAATSDIIDVTGLGAYADRCVAELSTGTRRIVELASLIAGGGRLLLLDEPTAGIAQREVEAFAGVIQQVRTQLQASILLIEHDMPLVMSLSDRVVCMTEGQVIAEGTPDVIRNDPRVIAAYLGTDQRAIDRSDLLVGTHA
jgi:ABC-type branched-subunit amino acid transport system ATPase component/ABC-type branched-subunit amino acid transport system permease subunit